MRNKQVGSGSFRFLFQPQNERRFDGGSWIGSSSAADNFAGWSDSDHDNDQSIENQRKKWLKGNEFKSFDFWLFFLKKKLILRNGLCVLILLAFNAKCSSLKWVKVSLLGKICVLLIFYLSYLESVIVHV
jgi:hypothetical protein